MPPLPPKALLEPALATLPPMLEPLVLPSVPALAVPDAPPVTKSVPPVPLVSSAPPLPTGLSTAVAHAQAGADASAKQAKREPVPRAQNRMLLTVTEIRKVKMIPKDRS